MPHDEAKSTLAPAAASSVDDLVHLEKVELSDDEDDDAFQYSTMDDAALGIDGDLDDDEEEDFDAVLRNLNKATTTRLDASNDSPGRMDAKLPAPTTAMVGSSASVAPLPGASRLQPYTQVRPPVVDDFIRNFLIKVGLTRTLDMFNHEWYEFVSKGKLKEDEVGVVPDIYMRNQALDDQVRQLRQQLDATSQIAEKAKGTWDKFRRQRDVHKMHHQRVLQEKETLTRKIKQLEKHITAYEPLLQELKAKYESSMKEKMLMRLERDRHCAKAEALEAQVKALVGSSNNNTAGKTRKEPVESPRDSSSTASPSSSKSSSTSKKKGSAGESRLPPQESVNPFADKQFEPIAANRLQLAQTCRGHANSIAAVAFHPRNPLLATVSDDQTWKLWSLPACELVISGEGHRSWIAGIEFHPRGTHVATSSGDHTVKLWDFQSASCSLTLSDHAQPVWESAFHHEGDFLVSASMDHTCKVWDLATGKCRKTLRGHVDSVNSVCFQPFTTNICTGSSDKTISIWDFRSGLCVQTFYGHQNSCNSVTFSLQGDVIASCDADGCVKLWDVRMVAERMSLGVLGPHALNSLCLDLSSQVLVAASDDGTIKLWDLKNEGAASELKGHDGPVQSVKFDPNGRFLASSSSDCTFRLWST